MKAKGRVDAGELCRLYPGCFDRRYHIILALCPNAMESPLSPKDIGHNIVAVANTILEETEGRKP